MPDEHETFVLRPGRVRVVLLTIGLVFCGALFYFMALVCLAIKVDSVLARFALMLLALFLAALATYFLLVLRTTIIRIEVGPERLKLRLPRVRGPLPVIGTIRADLPYGDIVSVERREEVYVSFGLVTVQRVFSILTRNGVRIVLGVMAENWGAQMRFDRAAELIAARAHVPVADRGTVRVGGVIRAMIRDVPPWGAETTDTAVRSRWHRRATLSMQLLMLLVSLTAVLRACSHS
jgi:hypothetical protein